MSPRSSELKGSDALQHFAGVLGRDLEQKLCGWRGIALLSHWFHFASDEGAFACFGHTQIGGHLQAQPEALARREIARQAQIVFGRAAAFAVFHSAEVRRRDAGGLRDGFLAEGGFFEDFGQSLGEAVDCGGLAHGLNDSR